MSGTSATTATRPTQLLRTNFEARGAPARANEEPEHVAVEVHREGHRHVHERQQARVHPERPPQGNVHGRPAPPPLESIDRGHHQRRHEQARGGVARCERERREATVAPPHGHERGDADHRDEGHDRRDRPHPRVEPPVAESPSRPGGNPLALDPDPAVPSGASRRLTGHASIFADASPHRSPVRSSTGRVGVPASPAGLVPPASS